MSGFVDEHGRRWPHMASGRAALYDQSEDQAVSVVLTEAEARFLLGFIDRNLIYEANQIPAIELVGTVRRQLRRRD